MANKTFFLNRDGATPQILPANDRMKMRVYDYIEDVDLTELEDGEIISTKGEIDSKGVMEAVKALTLPVGAVCAFYGSITNGNWLLCDGRDTTGTDEELAVCYPLLYTYLGNSNVLPDLRECVLVGAGQNATDTIADHNVYTVGQFKDDRLQNITGKFGAVVPHDHSLYATGAFKGGDFGETHSTPLGSDTNTMVYGYYFDSSRTARTGTTTHGKEKGVNYYIKATNDGNGAVPSDLQQYVKNQNILSEWETITLPTTSATAITMPYDGFLRQEIGMTPGAYAYLYINSSAFCTGSCPSDLTSGNNISSCIPFNKGDTIYTNMPGFSYAAYYKLRDYTGRT